MYNYFIKHVGRAALLGVIFGISEWFYSILNIFYALTGIQHPALVYVTWIAFPAFIAMYESIRTRRALLAYITANVFLLTAVLGYYASYVFDLLFLNTNELLNEYHYITINWSSFVDFVVHTIGSNIVEWSIVSLALGLVIGLMAMIVVATLEYVARSKAAQW